MSEKMEGLGQYIPQKGKSSAEGTTVEEHSASWCFYDGMSFMHPHIQSLRYLSNKTYICIGTIRISIVISGFVGAYI